MMISRACLLSYTLIALAAAGGEAEAEGGGRSLRGASPPMPALNVSTALNYTAVPYWGTKDLQNTTGAGPCAADDLWQPPQQKEEGVEEGAPPEGDKQISTVQVCVEVVVVVHARIQGPPTCCTCVRAELPPLRRAGSLIVPGVHLELPPGLALQRHHFTGRER
jgi:hypothetical protein